MLFEWWKINLLSALANKSVEKPLGCSLLQSAGFWFTRGSPVYSQGFPFRWPRSWLPTIFIYALIRGNLKVIQRAL